MSLCLEGFLSYLYLDLVSEKKKRALSLSLFVSFIFLKKRYLYFSPIKLLYASIILGTLNTLIFQNSIISRPSCSPAVWRLFGAGALVQRVRDSHLHLLCT